MPLVKLITQTEWEKMSPRGQGYALYWQSSLPGSELRDVTCPYVIGSDEEKEFAAGELQAILDVQDGEE